MSHNNFSLSGEIVAAGSVGPDDELLFYGVFPSCLDSFNELTDMLKATGYPDHARGLAESIFGTSWQNKDGVRIIPLYDPDEKISDFLPTDIEYIEQVRTRDLIGINVDKLYSNNAASEFAFILSHPVSCTVSGTYDALGINAAGYPIFGNYKINKIVLHGVRENTQKPESETECPLDNDGKKGKVDANTLAKACARCYYNEICNSESKEDYAEEQNNVMLFSGWFIPQYLKNLTVVPGLLPLADQEQKKIFALHVHRMPAEVYKAIYAALKENCPLYIRVYVYNDDMLGAKWNDIYLQKRHWNELNAWAKNIVLGGNFQHPRG